MIAFEELVAALDQWRMRNGLPVASVDVRPSGAPPAPPAAYSYTPPAAAATYGYPPTPGSGPVASAPSPRLATDSEVLALGDDEMVDEADVADEADVPGVADAYDNEGDDFAMSFDGRPVASAGFIESTHDVAAPDEPTAMGAMPGAPPPLPAVSLEPGLEFIDDDPAVDPDLDPALDPAIDPDDEFANSPPTPPAGMSAAPVAYDTLDADDEVLEEATVVGGDGVDRS